MDKLLASTNGPSIEPTAATAAQECRNGVFGSVWTIVAVALLIRLIVMKFSYATLLDPARNHFAFGFEFGQVARSIVTGQGFSSPYPEPSGPTALVGPGYAYLLAGIFKIFGLFTTTSALVTLTLNNLLSSLTCLPVFLIARRFWGSKIAVWSGWGWAFFPHSIAGSNIWVWETVLTTFLLTTLLLYTLYLEDSTSYLAWLGYGLLWAASALTSAVTLSTLPFLGIWILARHWKSQTVRLWPIIGSSLVFLVAVTPWVWRCSNTYGRFVAFRGNFGLEVLVGNSNDTSHPSNWNVLPGYDDGEMAKLQRLGESKYMVEKQKQAEQIIMGRPFWYIGQSFRRILFTWTNLWDFPPGWNFSESGLPDVIVCTLSSALAFIGLRWAIQDRWEETIPLLIPLAFFPIIYYITHQDDDRFRHPIDPVIIIFAACGAYSLLSRRNSNPSLETVHLTSLRSVEKQASQRAEDLRNE